MPKSKIKTYMEVTYLSEQSMGHGRVREPNRLLTINTIKVSSEKNTEKEEITNRIYSTTLRMNI